MLPSTLIAEFSRRINREWSSTLRFRFLDTDCIPRDKSAHFDTLASRWSYVSAYDFLAPTRENRPKPAPFPELRQVADLRTQNRDRPHRQKSVKVHDASIIAPSGRKTRHSRPLSTAK